MFSRETAPLSLSGLSQRTQRLALHTNCSFFSVSPWHMSEACGCQVNVTASGVLEPKINTTYEICHTENPFNPPKRNFCIVFINFRRKKTEYSSYHQPSEAFSWHLLGCMMRKCWARCPKSIMLSAVVLNNTSYPHVISALALKFSTSAACHTNYSWYAHAECIN